MSDADGRHPVADEIDRHHRVLARWLGTPAPDEVLARFRDAHCDGFAMIAADGRVLDLDALLRTLAAAGNSRPGLRIRTSEVTVVIESPRAVVARYLQTRLEPAGTSARRVCALLEHSPDGPRWRHLQETLVG